MTGSVDVTPLEPPFSGKVLRISFEAYPKELVLSEEDGKKLLALFDHAKLVGREVVISPIAGSEMVRVSIAQ